MITDLEGTIIDTNKAALEFFGYSYQELPGAKIQDMYVNLEDSKRSRIWFLNVAT